MAKGLAVITGSSTVVLQMLEDGNVVFGQDVAAAVKISGSFTLVEGNQGAGKYLRSDASGTGSWTSVPASEITVTPVAQVTSSNVQSAIEELSNDIAAVAAAGSGSLSVSDGTSTETIQTDGIETMTISGTTSEVEVSYSVATNTFAVGLPDNVVIAGNLTVQNDLIVNGTSSILNVNNLVVEDPLILLGSGNAGSSLDMGLIMSRSGDNVGFIYDESLDEFAVIATSENGQTAGNVTISDYLDLHVGRLIADDQVTASNGILISAGGLRVTGSVLLPVASITNANLVNSTFEITASTGLTGGGTGILGSGLSLSVNFGSGAGQAVSGNTQLTINGTTNEIEVIGSPVNLGNPTAITIGLPNDVRITNDLDVAGNTDLSGNVTLGTDGADLVLANGKFRIPVFTTASVPTVYVTDPTSYDGHMFYLSGSGSGSGDFQTADKWYFNEGGVWFKSFFKVT